MDLMSDNDVRKREKSLQSISATLLPDSCFRCQRALMFCEMIRRARRRTSDLAHEERLQHMSDDPAIACRKSPEIFGVLIFIGLILAAFCSLPAGMLVESRARRRLQREASESGRGGIEAVLR
jgi:hypothetical protein